MKGVDEVGECADVGFACPVELGGDGGGGKEDRYLERAGSVCVSRKDTENGLINWEEYTVSLLLCCGSWMQNGLYFAETNTLHLF